MAFRSTLKFTTISESRNNEPRTTGTEALLTRRETAGKAPFALQIAGFGRMAEVQRGVSEVCPSRSPCLQWSSGQQEQTAGTATAAAGAAGGGGQRCAAPPWPGGDAGRAPLGWLSVCSYPSSHSFFPLSFSMSGPP